ncbi:MAG: hypothetical protein IIA60_12965, partial [Candidatus Marinimicrobia bacterium]|nr:hypothetical protein [Candidatus Neomarinimicrobiota bacterium]
MSLTDRFLASRTRAKVQRVFDSLLKADSGCGTHFPMGADPAADSYFEGRSKTHMSPEDFHLHSKDIPVSLRDFLSSRWEEEGHRELAINAGAVASLATLLKELKPEGQIVSANI